MAWGLKLLAAVRPYVHDRGILGVRPTVARLSSELALALSYPQHAVAHFDPHCRVKVFLNDILALLRASLLLFGLATLVIWSSDRSVLVEAVLNHFHSGLVGTACLVFVRHEAILVVVVLHHQRLVEVHGSIPVCLRVYSLPLPSPGQWLQVLVLPLVGAPSVWRLFRAWVALPPRWMEWVASEQLLVHSHLFEGNQFFWRRLLRPCLWLRFRLSIHLILARPLFLLPLDLVLLQGKVQLAFLLTLLLLEPLLFLDCLLEVFLRLLPLLSELGELAAVLVRVGLIPNSFSLVQGLLLPLELEVVL